MKKLLWILGIIATLVVGFYAINSYIYHEKQEDEGVAADYRNGRYLIEGDFVQLRDGTTRMPAATDGSSEVVTQYFGNEVRADFDHDGDEDVAFLLTQTSGGSGLFYYLVGALKEEDGYRGTTAVFIGDRIAPQTTEFRDGLVIVNYADRADGEPKTQPPGVGKSKYLTFESSSQRFVDVAPVSQIDVYLEIHDWKPKSLRIIEDGTVTYTKKEGSDEIQETIRVSPDEVQELVRFIEQIGFFGFEEKYYPANSPTDKVSHTVTATIGGGTKRVYCYYGCPAGFDDLVKRIKQFWPEEINYEGFAYIQDSV